MCGEVVGRGVALHVEATRVVCGEVNKGIGDVHDERCEVASVESSNSLRGDHLASAIERSFVSLEAKLSLLLNRIHWGQNGVGNDL